MTTLSKVYNNWLQKGNDIDPVVVKENISNYLDSYINNLAESMVERSEGSLKKEEVIKDSYDILNKNPDAFSDTIFSVLDKIKADHGGMASGISDIKSGDFDYYTDENRLLNFDARFKEEYFKIAMEANAKIESGNSYTAENDYGAYGKYQIMWANYIGWGKQVGIDIYSELSPVDSRTLKYYMKIKSGKRYSDLRRYDDEAETYNLNKRALDIIKKTSVTSPKNQEEIASMKFLKYFKTKKDWALSVASWYCGPSNMTSADKIKGCKSGDPKYPDATAHVNKFLKKFVEMGSGKQIKKPAKLKDKNILDQKLSSKILNDLFVKKASTNMVLEKDRLNRIIMHFLK